MGTKYNLGKSLLCTFASFLSIIPYASLIPVMPVYIKFCGYDYAGFLVLAFVHLGWAIGRLFLSLFVYVHGTRIALIFGSLLQLIFLLYLT